MLRVLTDALFICLWIEIGLKTTTKSIVDTPTSSLGKNSNSEAVFVSYAYQGIQGKLNKLYFHSCNSYTAVSRKQ